MEDAAMGDAMRVGGDRGAAVNGALLGAAVAVTLAALGFCLPLVTQACRGVMGGLALPLAVPTQGVVAIGWWWMVGGAVVVAGGLVAKEWFVGRRAALAINAAALALSVVVAALAVLAVVMLLISMGESLAE